MSLYIIFLHILLAIPLLLIVNWIGKNASFKGYQELGLGYAPDTKPAFNFLLRVVSPVVYIVLISSILIEVELSNLTKGIYFLTLYYFILRWLIICLVKDLRGMVNWGVQVLHLTVSFFFSYVLYKKFISQNISLLPDLENLKNEIWIAIIIFLYYIVNQIQINSNKVFLK